MEKITFQDLPSTSTPISATNLNAIQTNVEDVFNGDVPMGSIVVDDISGKNMLNSNIFINAYVSNAGVITNDTKQALFDYIEVESNKTYTVSVKQTIQSIYVVRYDSSKTFIDRVPASTTSSNTFTTTSATKYIIIFINYDNSSTITKSIIDSLDLQLELGSTVTTYTPHKSFGAESGSGYIKYDDGTMICYGSFTKSTACNTALTNGGYRNSGGSGNWITFPQTFISAPQVLVDNSTLNCIGCIPDGITTTYFTALFTTINSESSASSKSGNYIAIGRWK